MKLILQQLNGKLIMALILLMKRHKFGNLMMMNYHLFLHMIGMSIR